MKACVLCFPHWDGITNASHIALLFCAFAQKVGHGQHALQTMGEADRKSFSCWFALDFHQALDWACEDGVWNHTHGLRSRKFVPWNGLGSSCLSLFLSGRLTMLVQTTTASWSYTCHYHGEIAILNPVNQQTFELCSSKSFHAEFLGIIIVGFIHADL